MTTTAAAAAVVAVSKGLRPWDPGDACGATGAAAPAAASSGGALGAANWNSLSGTEVGAGLVRPLAERLPSPADPLPDRRRPSALPMLPSEDRWLRSTPPANPPASAVCRGPLGALPATPAGPMAKAAPALMAMPAGGPGMMLDMLKRGRDTGKAVPLDRAAAPEDTSKDRMLPSRLLRDKNGAAALLLLLPPLKLLRESELCRPAAAAAAAAEAAMASRMMPLAEDRGRSVPLEPEARGGGCELRTGSAGMATWLPLLPWEVEDWSADPPLGPRGICCCRSVRPWLPLWDGGEADGAASVMLPKPSSCCCRCCCCCPLGVAPPPLLLLRMELRCRCSMCSMPWLLTRWGLDMAAAATAVGSTRPCAMAPLSASVEHCHGRGDDPWVEPRLAVKLSMEARGVRGNSLHVLVTAPWGGGCEPGCPCVWWGWCARLGVST